MTWKRMTRSETRKIVRLRQDGFSIWEIARIVGRNGSSVGQKLRELKIEKAGFNDAAFDRAEGIKQ